MGAVESYIEGIAGLNTAAIEMRLADDEAAVAKTRADKATVNYQKMSNSLIPNFLHQLLSEPELDMPATLLQLDSDPRTLEYRLGGDNSRQLAEINRIDKCATGILALDKALSSVDVVQPVVTLEFTTCGSNAFLGGLLGGPKDTTVGIKAKIGQTWAGVGLTTLKDTVNEVTTSGVTKKENITSIAVPVITGAGIESSYRSFDGETLLDEPYVINGVANQPLLYRTGENQTQAVTGFDAVLYDANGKIEELRLSQFCAERPYDVRSGRTLFIGSISCRAAREQVGSAIDYRSSTRYDVKAFRMVNESIDRELSQLAN